MKLPIICEEFILQADAKALATFSTQSGAHVVPVSTVKIVDNDIVLINYFFGQTLKNLRENSEVALACWKGLAGYQVKATARYEEEGELFDSIKSWVAEILPDRVVKGIVILKPKSVFDISADAEKAGKEVV